MLMLSQTVTIIYNFIANCIPYIFIRGILCYISDPSGTDRQVAIFCDGSASVPRGYVTSPISISSGEAVPAGDTDCMLIDQKNVAEQNCGELQNYL